jgi:hypothetical protein
MSYELSQENLSEKIKKKICERGGVLYNIMNYDEQYVCDDDLETGKYRSVVFSEPEGELLCFSPPKSIPSKLFEERNSGSKEKWETTEMIEGIMISLFWDKRINSWQIATKGAIGGEYWFFRTEKQLTFRQMLLEALQTKEGEDINDIPIIKELGSICDKKLCYNFVLQHPSNHIVLTIEKPRLFLISVYRLDGGSAEFVSPKIYREWAVFYGENSMIEFPQDVSEENDMPWCVPGHMILNTETGDRMCIENPAYKEVKELRGNNPNLHYHYFCLLRIGKIQNFLDYFPQYKRIFSKFYKQFETFITNTHQYYVNYFIKRMDNIIPKNYFMLIQRLHKEIYIPSLHQSGETCDDSMKKSVKIIMKRPIIREGFLKLNPQEMFYYIYPK